MITNLDQSILKEIVQLKLEVKEYKSTRCGKYFEKKRLFLTMNYILKL